MRRLNNWVGPLLFGLLIYVSVDNYGYSMHGYNRQVAGYVFIAAATLLLFATLTGRRFVNLKPTLPFAVALATSLAISTWNAANPGLAINRLPLYYAVALLGIGFYLAHRDDETNPVWRYFTVVPLVHMVFLVYVIFYLIRIQSEPDPTFRWFPNFANIRHFAYFGFISAACATSLFALTRKLQSTAFVLTTASLFGIVVLGARGALLAWVVYAACFALFCERRTRFLLFCAAAVVVASAVVFYLGETGLLRTPSLFVRLEPGGSGFMVTDRLAIWLDALRAIIARPFFGYGAEGYITSRCCNPHVSQPHNFILQFLLEFGLVGVALMVATAWAMIRTCGGVKALWVNLHSEPGFLAVSSVLAGFFAYALIDGLFYYAIPLTHFALFAALLLSGMSKGERGQIPSCNPTFDLKSA